MTADESDETRTLIWDKVRFLEAAERLTPGIDLIEPLIDDLVDRILVFEAEGGNPSDNLEIMTENIDLARMYVLQIYAHTTRSPWLRTVLLDAKGSEPDFRKQRLYDLILEAFDDDWPRRILFARFGES